jgi:uncharacterized protein YyaL (SSP411 family)
MNRLNAEKSLYLKQHDKNPVHWWPYSEEAFAEAKKQNKPIFISIGYSSCHWCHVMAHESFEDQQTADFLNKNFINIKVDREELPEVDHYYQKACQAFRSNGGWPLSVFLTHDQKPIFIGTYFPKEAKYQGVPTFTQLSNEILTAIQNQPLEIAKTASEIKTFVESKPEINKMDLNVYFPHPQDVLNALEKFKDKEFGGYGSAPKFPHFAFYEWALEQMLEGHATKEQGDFIMDSIEKMMMGGIYDHLKGGMHRYSTDEKWMVPHFEKMLYDQSGLLRMLCKASVMYPTPLFLDALVQTLNYLESEMLHEKGYFMSAQDADSEGQEGLYFTFSKEEILETIEQSEDEELIKNKQQLLDWFNIQDQANFEHELNVISLNYNKRNEFYAKNGWELVRKVRQILLENRKCRIPPATDDKGIAAWNFMLITSLIDVAQYCQVEVIRQNAFVLIQNNLETIQKTFVHNAQDGQTHILHSTTKEESKQYFEDYVFFAEMQLRLYELTGEKVFKENFAQLIEYIENIFSKDHEFMMTSVHEKGLLPNLMVNAFDSSYRSPYPTYIILLKRYSVLFSDTQKLTKFADSIENLRQHSLQFPLAAGEGLRAMTFPIEAYRKIEVPLEWIQELEFKNIAMFLSSRIVLDYHTRGDHFFQICHASACEKTGTTFEEFKNLFKPAGEQNA